MSGHSKWATIKRKKGAADAKRGKVFSKYIKEITIAARIGGGDPAGNPRLRTAIDAAKAQNMPQDNITRAIKRGTGDVEGVTYEESIYEGYGPGGVALLIQVLTDNKNRTVAEIRHLLARGGGNMGESGSVAWMFHKKGVFSVENSSANEEQIMDATLEAGIDDIEEIDDLFEITCPADNFEAVQNALKAANIAPLSASNDMVPQNTIKVEGEAVGKMLKLMENIEDHDDVQNVYANFDISDEDMEQFS